MIVTREWLREWLDFSGNSREILNSLNSIGLEVDSLKELRVPDGVVVGFINSCQRHPDADKLNICQVDIKEEVVQVVCGAKNVSKGQYVAVAKVGATLNGDLMIKKAELRGVESNGMICSASEIGLVDVDDGILVLDNSIGDIEIGAELNRFPLLNDDIIDIELTANRGDCLSIRGVARDLSAVLDSDLKRVESSFSEDTIGIGQFLKLDVSSDVESEVEYRVVDIDSINLPLLYRFRLSCIGIDESNSLRAYLAYATHSCGVIFRAYDFKKLSQKGRVILDLHINNLGFDIVESKGRTLSIVGVNQDREFMVNDIKRVIIEASFISPETISKKISENSTIAVDDLFYKTSRGSEQDLSFGLSYLCSAMEQNSDLLIYAGSQSYKKEFEPKIVKIDQSYIDSFIGQNIPSDKIFRVLNRLGFGVKLTEGSFLITIAPFRHDILNREDIIEEIVRVVGIDNIESKPLEFKESRSVDSMGYGLYKKINHFRQRASGVGFFETIHYFFDNKEISQKYAELTLKESLDILNPITNELNTLRTTLVLNLLNSASRNIKFSKKSVRLFEIGRVVNELREERVKIAFIFSGELEMANIMNSGKPEEIDFFEFTKQISKVVGDIEIKSEAKERALISPYESARVYINGVDVGYIARVRVGVEREFGLPKTYISELDFNSLIYENIDIKSYSKFPPLFRDLSFVIPKSIKFSKIREFLKEIKPKEIKEFYPIDVYEDEKLKDNRSVTIRFSIQSDSQTLVDEQIDKMIQEVIFSLKDRFGVDVR